MPASICDTVSNALRRSLTADEPPSSSILDNRLLSSAKSVLLSKIEFEEAGDYQSNVLDGLKSKYVLIRPQQKNGVDGKILKKESNSSSNNNGTHSNSNGLPIARHTLFPQSEVNLGWSSKDWRIGAGMHNVGNTCYLNSTLQALLHVPAFANWLMTESGHAQRCKQSESCVICGMRATLMAAQQSSTPIKPWQVYSKLRLICRHLTPGRQEDAHEFLRYLVEAMEKSYLSRFPGAERLDQYSKETTPLNQILGGYLRSNVRCLSCGHISTTFQHFQDLLLDIRKPVTLDEALDGFFSRERLEDLGYKCEACNKKVSATKQFFVERAPMVLCIAFKRFSLAGGKLSKHIQFRKRISLQNYMFRKQQNPLWYRLCALVSHLGASQNCGHYTASALCPGDPPHYYHFDDSSVRALPVSSLLATNAYIMFYEMEEQVVVNGNSITKAKTSLEKLQEDYRSNGHESDTSHTNSHDPFRQSPSRVMSPVRVSLPTSTVTSNNGDNITSSTSHHGDTTQSNGEHTKNSSLLNSKVINISIKNGLSNTNGNSIRSRDTSPSSNHNSCNKFVLVTTTTKATQLGWKVSKESEKTSPTTSVAAILNRNKQDTIENSNNNSSTCKSNGITNGSKEKESSSSGSSNVLSQLQKNTHNGYGAPVSTWNATHSHIQRQAYEESREERKRAAESTDDMDRGRVKKVKSYQSYSNSNRYGSHSRNGYNPFQIRQDKQRQWSSGGSSNGNGFRYNDRRSYHGGHRHGHYKHRKFHGYGNGHYNRHH